MASNFSRPVTACVMEINTELDEGKVADLVKYCKLRKGDIFTERDGEECTDFCSLFEKLSHLDIIRSGSIYFVEEILEDIRRIDLAKKIRKANESVETTQSDGGNPEEQNHQQQGQGTRGAQGQQGAQKSGDLYIFGHGNKVFKDCNVNMDIRY